MQQAAVLNKPVQPTGIERQWGEEEIIVSKTDLKGRVTYANDVFMRVSMMSEQELLGQPHNIIRHPDMPRCVFKLLWDTLAEGREIFAYVVNMAKNGDHYWVLAHVTPSFDDDGKIIGYHSSRRKPRVEAIQKIEPIYKTLLNIEKQYSKSKEGLEHSFKALIDTVAETGMPYDQFVFTL